MFLGELNRWHMKTEAEELLLSDVHQIERGRRSKVCVFAPNQKIGILSRREKRKKENVVSFKTTSIDTWSCISNTLPSYKHNSL